MLFWIIILCVIMIGWIVLVLEQQGSKPLQIKSETQPRHYIDVDYEEWGLADPLPGWKGKLWLATQEDERVTVKMCAVVRIRDRSKKKALVVEAIPSDDPDFDDKLMAAVAVAENRMSILEAIHQ